MNTTQLPTAGRLMLDFAERSGLTGSQAPDRYLWTDAFAVCNFLALYRAHDDAAYLSLAKKLIEEVHEVLGRYAPGSGKEGYLSGLPPEEAALHPTLGGLRIGKKEAERPEGAAYDPEKEWDRDGQYFHYLTKWMHALAHMSEASREVRYLLWAAELAQTAHKAFTWRDEDGQLRMYWKMRTELSAPLLPSMGQLDPLDGLVTFSMLRAKMKEWKLDEIRLDAAIDDMREICGHINTLTDDPLGLGGLLSDSYFLSALIAAGYNREDEVRLERMLSDSARGMAAFLATPALHLPAAQRLAFRELGLAIGLHALDKSGEIIEKHKSAFALSSGLQELLSINRKFIPVGDAIEIFWLEEQNQESQSWKAHLNINTVMLATALLPDGYLSF